MNNQAGFIANWIAEQNLAIEEDIAEASKLPKGHFFKAAYELPNKQGTVRFTSKGRSMTAPTTLWVMGPKDKEYEEYKEYKNMAAAKKEYDRMKSDALKEELDLFEGGTYDNDRFLIKDFDAAEYKKHGVTQVIEEVLLNEAKQKVVVYDNGGKTTDRYTVFITYATGQTLAFGMSDNPLSPNGYNQYVGMVPRAISPGKHQGKKLRRIPKEIEKAVKVRMKEGVKEASFDQFELDEELSPDEIAKEQSTAIDQFNNDMAKKFPKEKFTARAGVAPMGGGITFMFAVIPTKDAKGVDLLNAPAHSKFIMHLTDNANKAVPMSKFSIEHLMGRLPAKFRKITGKSPTDAVKKLVDWFKKNKSGFEGLVKEEVELDEEFKEKDFDSLKKGDIITIEFDAPMSSGTSKFKVTAKNIVGKAKVHKATLQNVKNPRSVKFFLYKRGNKVTLAQGDMAASVVKYTVEEVELDENTGKYKREYEWMLDAIDKLEKKKNLSTKEKDRLFKYGKELEWLKKKLGIKESVELSEALKPKDKKVIDAFYDKKKLEGKLLFTDGDKLEKLGMGRDTVAVWKGHKIEITSSSAVKSDDVILRYMKKSIPKLNFDPKSYKKYFGEEIEKTYIGVDFMKINQHQFLNPLAPSSMWPLGEKD